ncbi:ParB/RepB/Spo0J family partition protein [Maritimibacter sp. DP1N21-5]|uniref:ParB/RepB/Spo0J family partition protein n=1 Tax=Maritimibacter sp. DP1N21-5 TaxID=2836867 RepID=UPI001C454428|nr:ParB/RepB/Spo0J family partition protein [Maritimibacter sp. DP1N21-5]MBV7411013.1 ParB/RepB/Spo0J family partition protein [Maritimibacter sp. DP1N21-5]
MATPPKNRGLGRGLSALMADVQTEPAKAASEQPTRKPDMMIPIGQIMANPTQPRRTFSPDALGELTASIKEKGVIQPLIVRPHPTQEGAYEIVAGERRWRAAQAARLHEVPAIIRSYTEQESYEVAIIENIQRADLNPVEEAAGYRDLMDKFGHTQEQLSEALGKSRSHLANMMRLLNLPAEVLDYVREGRLSAGAARAMITADDPLSIARQAISKGLSVREIEKLAKGAPEKKAPSRPATYRTKDADTVALEGDLSATLGMKVSIDHKTGDEGGSITISYKTLEELDDLCAKLGGGS